MPVTKSTPTSTPVARCTQRSASVNRGRVSAGRGIVAPVGVADPGVDVVAEVLPVARNDAVDDPDLTQPLAALVAVHGGDEQPGGPAVLAADRPAVDAVR